MLDSYQRSPAKKPPLHNSVKNESVLDDSPSLKSPPRREHKTFKERSSPDQDYKKIVNDVYSKAETDIYLSDFGPNGFEPLDNVQ